MFFNSWFWKSRNVWLVMFFLLLMVFVMDVEFQRYQAETDKLSCQKQGARSENTDVQDSLPLYSCKPFLLEPNSCFLKIICPLKCYMPQKVRWMPQLWHQVWFVFGGFNGATTQKMSYNTKDISGSINYIENNSLTKHRLIWIWTDGCIYSPFTTYKCCLNLSPN